MSLKILVLKDWMKLDKESKLFLDCVSKVNEISPTFNRAGIYLENGVCWFESDGRAWEYHMESFIFSLRLLDASELRPEDIEGLESICKSSLATKLQRQLLLDLRFSNEIRNTHRNSMKLTLKSIIK